ncbi:MAG: flagellar hook-associated protein FlgK [Planctomycetota bacterium]
MTLGLDIGLRGLRAAQAALDTVGHNLSNANTPGYSRQRVDLNTSSPSRVRGILFGTGVETDGVRRITDALLNKRIRTQVSVLSGLDIQLQGMSRIEELLSEPGENGLGALFDNFFGSVSQLSTDPGDQVLRNSMVQSGLNLTDEFNHLSSAIRDAEDDNLQELQFHVGEVNRLAHSVRELNAEIVQAEASQLPANDLRDRREQELRSLAEQVDITFTEQDSGAVVVRVAGRVLVGTQNVQEMQVDATQDGDLTVRIQGSDAEVLPSGGQIGGLLDFRSTFLPKLRDELDGLAKNLILEVNRAHSTGTPEEGGFTLLSGSEAVAGDTQAERLGKLLRSAGLPFSVEEGRLYVNMTDMESGEVKIEYIDIDPDRTTVADLLASLNEIENMNAGLDSLGRLNLYSESGYQFDFSARLDESPNDYFTMGGGRATLGSSSNGPYSLTAGSSLSIQGPTGSAAVIFQASDFANIGSATAEEVAQVINQDAAMIAAGVQAHAVGDRLVIQSRTEGSTETVAVQGGGMATALGFTAGQLATGRDTSLQVEMFGSYNGDKNRTLYYQPAGDGIIGTTPGLQIRVVSEDGSPVAVLNVGEGYVPGTRLDVGDGVQVSFGYGEISATNREVFKQDMIADSDSSDVLVAFGVNSFLTGSTASTIQVAAEIQENPSRLSYSGTGSSGDNGTLLSILSLQDTSVDQLGLSIPEYYSQIVGEVGFDISTTESAAFVAESLVNSLDARREEVSGVNTDEELVNMVRFEQAYSASARYIQVIQQLNDTILSIL